MSGTFPVAGPGNEFGCLRAALRRFPKHPFCLRPAAAARAGRALFFFNLFGNFEKTYFLKNFKNVRDLRGTIFLGLGAIFGPRNNR